MKNIIKRYGLPFLALFAYGACLSALSNMQAPESCCAQARAYARPHYYAIPSERVPAGSFRQRGRKYGSPNGRLHVKIDLKRPVGARFDNTISPEIPVRTFFNY